MKSNELFWCFLQTASIGKTYWQNPKTNPEEPNLLWTSYFSKFLTPEVKFPTLNYEQ